MRRVQYELATALLGDEDEIARDYDAVMLRALARAAERWGVTMRRDAQGDAWIDLPDGNVGGFLLAVGLAGRFYAWADTEDEAWHIDADCGGMLINVCWVGDDGFAYSTGAARQQARERRVNAMSEFLESAHIMPSGQVDR